MKTPVALFIFNRPDLLKKTLSQIARVKPKRIFVVADGPRQNNLDDIVKCAASRALVDAIGWDCEIIKNYSNVNLGCRRRMVSGISWVFDQVESAIIIEDDCVLDPTFFLFAGELLDRYGNDKRVMAICAVSPLDGEYAFRGASYSFARHFQSWGWATWRRAWKLFDENIAKWPEVKDTHWLKQKIDGNQREAEYLHRAFDNVHRSSSHQIWDFHFYFACLYHDGLVVYPRKNLVSNIGYGPDATHTKHENHRYANWKTEPLLFPLVHPRSVKRNRLLDELFLERQDLSIRGRLRRKLLKYSRIILRTSLGKLVWQKLR